jgi:heme exporter protein C
LLWPLVVMALGITTLFVAMQLKAMRNEILRRRLKTLRRVAAETASGLSQQPAH